MATYEEQYNALSPSSRAFMAAPGSQLLTTINRQNEASNAAFAGAGIRDPFGYALGAGSGIGTPAAAPAPSSPNFGGPKVGNVYPRARGVTADAGNPAVPAIPTSSAYPDPFGGASQAGNENRSVSRSGLDPRLDQAFEFALRQALARYADPNGNTFYSGPTVADLTPDELAAQGLLRGVAGSAGGMGTDATAYLQAMLQRAQNPGNDATLQAAIDAMSRDTQRAATDPGGIFSQIRGDALASGSFGGTRQGVAEGLATGRVADAIARASADMRLAGRTQDVNAATSALGQMPNITNALTLPASLLSGIGGQNRAHSQALLDAALRAWGYNTTQPDIRLQNLFSALGGTPLGGWNSGSTYLSDAALNNGGTSGIQNVVGGVAAAGGVYDLLHRAGII